MLYKFRSKAGGDVIMLGPAGDELMRIIGKEPAPKGIIQPADMPAAVQAIERAIANDEARRAKAEADARAEGKPLPPREGVTLRQRAWPLADLMKRAHADDVEIVWGV